MGLLRFEEVRARTDEPEGGWRPVCKVGDHRWKVRCEAGSTHLECIDPHSEDELNLMCPNGAYPGCRLEAEYLVAEFGPLALKWETDCPRRGYNDSGSHGHGCDCDHWVAIVDESVEVDA